MGIERDILLNAKYIISYFNENGKNITNLMLEKLLYFLEAIYMVVTDEDYLFYEDFCAWNFGPVNEIVYQQYKFYGRLPILLDEKVSIPLENKKYIEQLYDLFKDFNASDLVGLSHQEGSPWFSIDKQYDSEIPENVMISKIETKKWFHSIVESSNESKS